MWLENLKENKEEKKEKVVDIYRHSSSMIYTCYRRIIPGGIVTPSAGLHRRSGVHTEVRHPTRSRVRAISSSQSLWRKGRYHTRYICVPSLARILCCCFCCCALQPASPYRRDWITKIPTPSAPVLSMLKYTGRSLFHHPITQRFVFPKNGNESLYVYLGPD